MKLNRFFIIIIILALIVIFITGCNSYEYEKDLYNDKIKIITTLFPQYDFANEIVKDKGEVKLLLPPGVEAHSYEPTPKDIVDIKKADVFIYTGKYMEPWAEKMIKEIDDSTIVIDISKGIELVDEEDWEHNHEHHGKDPHIWLDPVYAQKIVDNILEGIIKADSKNENFYRQNAENYKEKLAELDKKFVETFSKVKHKTIIHGGHFAFGYFAKRYGLEYISPYDGFSPNAEPTPKKISELMNNMKSLGLNVIYYEELIDPKVAKIISEETGGKMLLLHGAHNISKEELESGISYIEIMESNLDRLKEGLGYDE
ncbi:MAG: zinc ABC transporter solute-binding protein [Tissierellia bacterium]|nr:zinc ABC transporter solute-binding protein [Tissierellia bacterium]NLV77240.1 zinc ABC transporter solute-binding protein [Tissierellia bacterium]